MTEKLVQGLDKVDHKSRVVDIYDEMTAKGASAKDVADCLNSVGIRTVTGRRWSAPNLVLTVSRIKAAMDDRSTPAGMTAAERVLVSDELTDAEKVRTLKVIFNLTRGT